MLDCLSDRHEVNRRFHCLLVEHSGSELACRLARQWGSGLVYRSEPPLVRKSGACTWFEVWLVKQMEGHLET